MSNENKSIVPEHAKHVAVTPQQKIRELLSRQQDQIAKALPKFLTAERFIRVALTTINKNPKLLDCTQESLMACLMDCAQLGLEPDNVMGRAYLIPFNDRKNNRVVCTLIVGYKGFCDLAYRSGKVKSLMAQIVCERDKFDFAFGLGHKLEHVPYFGEEDRGKVIAAYAYAIMENGVSAFDVMGVDDIERIKKRSKSTDNGPWVTDWDEMARKTVLKRLSKYLPISVEFMDAVALDHKSEEEDKLKAAKIVLPASHDAPPLPDKDEVIPMPSKSVEPEKHPVVTQEQPAASALHADESLTPEDKLATLMAQSGHSNDAFKSAFDKLDIATPKKFTGPDCMSDKAISQALEGWEIILDALKEGSAP